MMELLECLNLNKSFGDKEILKNINLKLPRGKIIGLLGKNGTGKSTLINLLARFYDPTYGAVHIDDINVKNIDLKTIHQNIASAMQDVFLFSDTVKNNIAYGAPNATYEDVIRVAKLADAHDFISKMPEGYDAPVTERGSTLSAGQRQLISFARTLAYKPSILVLDEATANIDTETESLITQALSTLMEGRTTIMVAHRLSTIQHADKIIVMHKGRIKESGSHQELLAQDGLYKKLYDLQLVE